MKKILIGVAGVIIVGVVAIVLLLGNVDKIVKGAMEGIGSELLGVPVTVAGVEIKLNNGSGQITGLTVANPAGFSTENAFQMDMIRLGINLGSLGEQPLVINELNIKNPVVRLDVKENGSSNLQVLLDGMEKNSASADKSAAENQPASKETAPGEPMRIAFGKLAVTGVTVHVNRPGAEPEKVVIPDIVRENVGQEAGLTPSEISKVIIGDIINSSLEVALKETITEKVGEATKGFFDGLKESMGGESGE